MLLPLVGGPKSELLCEDLCFRLGGPKSELLFQEGTAWEKRVSTSRKHSEEKQHTLLILHQPPVASGMFPSKTELVTGKTALFPPAF